MVDFDSFRSAAESVRSDATLTLRRGGDGINLRSGKLARWICGFRTSENQAMASRFIQSLRREFGRQVADDVVRSSGLERVLDRGKPLRARQVRQVIERAGSLSAALQTRNARLVQSFSEPVAVGTGTSLLEIKIEHEARKMLPRNPTVAQLVDARGIARTFEREIVAAGRSGTRFVTNEEAADILARIVRPELATAYRNARDSAFEKLSLDNPNSIAGRALVTAAAGNEPPLNLDPARLSPDARAELTSGLQLAVTDGETPVHRLADEDGLRALADKTMDRFVAQRAAARAAVAALPTLGREEKAAMLDQVVHDNVPHRLVPAMGIACEQVQDDVAALGTDLDTADLQGKIASIRHAMTDAFLEAEIEVDVDNQDSVHRNFWRFLLVPGGATQVQAIADRLKPAGSPLRAIGEGAMWYRAEFRSTQEAERTFRSEKTGDESLPLYPRESFSDAMRIAVLIGALADVAGERTDLLQTSLPLGIDGQLTDQTIVALRNLGVPMPAPGRLGDANPSVPVSEPAMEAIREELADHMQSLGGGELKGGLLEESTIDFERGIYRFEGKTLPANEAEIAAEFRSFCSDPESGLNEKLLKNLSMVAYQAGLGCLYATVLNPDRQDLAFVDSSLILVNRGRREYIISRDERGDVLVNCVRSGAVGHMHKLEGDGDLTDPIELDRSASRLRAAITFRIDAQTCEPKVEDVEISYALIPLPGSPESVSGPESGRVGE